MPSRWAWVVLAAVLSGCEAGPSAFAGGNATDSTGATADSALGTPADAAVSSAELPESRSDGSVVGRSGADAEPSPAGAGVEASDDGGQDVAGASSDGSAIGESAALPTSGSPRTAGSTRFPRPAAVRGIYLNAWASGSRSRVSSLLELARRTEINSFVVDIKDATGYLSHRSEIPMAQEVDATGEIRIRDLPGLLDTLEAEGIYPIARIVIVKDPLLAAARPELAIQDSAGGVWVDSKGIIWLNPHDPRVWEYHVAIAREVAEMGFPEIQWDYVRFPDAPASDLARAVYTGAGDVERQDALRGFFEYARTELADLGVQVTADVFGVTTTFNRDVGIGQIWEDLIDVVDVALPMVYPSHYWTGSFGIDTPNAYPYEVVREALEDAVRRSSRVAGAGLTRPWIQDFSLGQPRYEAPEVRAQIQAAYDVGIDEWILWNPGSGYTEDALEPAGGFLEEPMIRVGGQVVPVSQRWDLVDRVDPKNLGVLPDSAQIPEGVVDSTVVDVDSAAAAVDTIRGDTLIAGIARR